MDGIRIYENFIPSRVNLFVQKTFIYCTYLLYLLHPNQQTESNHDTMIYDIHSLLLSRDKKPLN